MDDPTYSIRKFLEDNIPAPSSRSLDDSKVTIDQVLSAFRGWAASYLQEPLNAKILNMPHTSVNDRQQVCSLVASSIDRYGLSLACPKRDIASTLQTRGYDENYDGIKFCFTPRAVTKEKGKHGVEELKRLKLIPSPIEPSISQSLYR